MKLIEHFDTFLSEVVNLNETRVTQLESSIEAIENMISGSDWSPEIIDFIPHGSWAHKTIIKPVEGKAFDADLLVLVKHINGWDAKKYIYSLRAVFASNKIYKDKIVRSSHCITVEYAGERKIDIAPCVVDRDGIKGFEVCNSTTNEFEKSEPEKYTKWLIERNEWTSGNSFRKVTRLLKYLRDIKTTFTCSSVLLTTILGYRIDSNDEYRTKEFCDLPTSLKTIVGRLDTWLQVNPWRPTVTNPVLASEVFSNIWDDITYTNFRSQINKYRGWIDDAYNETERDESIRKWRRVFGEDFAQNVSLEKAARVSDTAIFLAEQKSLIPFGSVDDLVGLFTRFGPRVIPSDFDRLPHKHWPMWPALANPLLVIDVVATRHQGRNSSVLGNVPNGSSPLAKHQYLCFRIQVYAGVLDVYEFEVHWRVTNTDREATQARCLRGGFEVSNDGLARWESLAYRGIHSVEAFVVRKRDKMLAAQSQPFYVVVA